MIAGWPAVADATMEMLCAPTEAHDCWKSTTEGSEDDAQVSTVFDSRPSMKTLAVPWVGPTEPIQATAAPVNLKPALALEAPVSFALPPR